MKARAVFSVDVEPDLHTNKHKGIEEGIPLLLNILKKNRIKATFFVTCDCIEKYPKLFTRLRRQGHEIALHGYTHERFDTLTFGEKEERIKKSISCFKKYLKINPRGFRAPQHSIDRDMIQILNKYGFDYDSSKTPGNLMLLRHLLRKKTNKQEILRNFFSHLKPYVLKNKLIEIPRTSFLISSGAFEIKLYPKIHYKYMALICKTLNIPLIFVMHSWDMINILESRTSRLCPSKNFIKKLDDFLKYSIKKLNYIKMEDLYEKAKNS